MFFFYMLLVKVKSLKAFTSLSNSFLSLQNMMIFLKKILFVFVWMCAVGWGGVSMETKKGCWLPWSWSYKVVVNCLMWMLGGNSGPLEEQEVLFNY